MKAKKTPKTVTKTPKNTVNQQVVAVVKHGPRKINVIMMNKNHLNAMMASRWHTSRIMEVYRLGSKMKIKPASVY